MLGIGKSQNKVANDETLFANVSYKDKQYNYALNEFCITFYKFD